MVIAQMELVCLEDAQRNAAVGLRHHFAPDQSVTAKQGHNRLARYRRVEDSAIPVPDRFRTLANEDFQKKRRADLPH